jgi:hypothetical protein
MKNRSVETGDSERVSQSSWKTAPSLKPGIEMMNGCVEHHPEAEAIRDSWAFRRKVIELPRDVYQSLVERSAMIFAG